VDIENKYIHVRNVSRFSAMLWNMTLWGLGAFAIIFALPMAGVIFGYFLFELFPISYDTACFFRIFPVNFSIFLVLRLMIKKKK